MATDKIPTSIRFESDTWKKIKFIAKKNKRSFNGQIEFLAEQCIDAYERENFEIDVSEIDDSEEEPAEE